MSDHTPIPWTWQQVIEGPILEGKAHVRRFPIYTAFGKWGHPADANTQADAEFIVLACNSHAGLLVACAEAAELLSVYLPESLPALKSLKAAVDKAKGKQ